MMLNNFRPISLTLAALALIVAPIGCNSDAPPSAVVEIHPAPTLGLDKLEREVDRDVRRTTGEVKQAVEEEKHEVKATEEEVKKSTERAVDNALGDPK